MVLYMKYFRQDQKLKTKCYSCSARLIRVFVSMKQRRPLKIYFYNFIILTLAEEKGKNNNLLFLSVKEKHLK